MKQPTAQKNSCIPAGWAVVDAGKGEIIVSAPAGMPGGMTLTDKERLLPQRLLYSLARAMLESTNPNIQPSVSGQAHTIPKQPSGTTAVAKMLPMRSAPAYFAPNDHLSGKDDPIYQQAVDVVRANNKASISLVQRHLLISYNRAACLVEAMEGTVLGAPNGAGVREVLPIGQEESSFKGSGARYVLRMASTQPSSKT